MLFNTISKNRLRGRIALLVLVVALVATFHSDPIALGFGIAVAVCTLKTSLFGYTTIKGTAWSFGELLSALAWRSRLNLIDVLDDRQAIWALVVVLLVVGVHFGTVFLAVYVQSRRRAYS